MKGHQPEQQDQFSYRVYNGADHSQSVAPVAFRTRKGVEPGKGGSGFFGVGLIVVTVVALIGGASFAAQRLLDAELGQSPRLAQAGAAAPAGPSFANSFGASTAPPVTTTTGAIVLPTAPDKSVTPEASAPPAPPPVVATHASAVPRAAVAAADSAASKFRKKLQQRRPTPAGSAPSGPLPSERGGLPATAEPPPNPF